MTPHAEPPAHHAVHHEHVDPNHMGTLEKFEAVHAELESPIEANEIAIADFKKREAKVLMKLDIYIAPLLGLFNFIVCLLPSCRENYLTTRSLISTVVTLVLRLLKGWPPTSI